jgi:hypothetical protein
MTTRISTSWQLLKASISITWRHPKLLWFPVATTAATMVIGIFFLAALAAPLAFHDTGYQLNQKEHWIALEKYYLPQSFDRHSTKAPGTGGNLGATGSSSTSQSWTLTPHGVYAASIPVVIYFVSMFLATFFNVAFYHEIIAALNGDAVSLRRGMAAARSRLPSILAWSLMAGLVGWAIRFVEERLPFGGRIVMALAGLAWSIASVFAIPVIVRESEVTNPVRVLKQSAATLKNAWGEGLAGYVGFSTAVFGLVLLSLLPLAAAGFLAYALSNGWIFAVAAALWLIGLVGLGYLSGVARNVFRCVLYLYAVEGVVPEPYNSGLLDQAWKFKSNAE